MSRQPDAQAIHDLRATGWTWGGIARIYQMTEAAVRLLAGEQADDHAGDDAAEEGRS